MEILVAAADLDIAAVKQGMDQLPAPETHRTREVLEGGWHFLLPIILLLWLLALPAQSFQEMLDHHPDLAKLAARIAEDRREQNKRTLRDALGHRNGKAGLI